MTQLTISPVTRIEGHAQVRIELDEAGEVAGAHFNVVELRGFEKFLLGAAVEEAPRITPRICGICPTSHHLAAAMACDRIFGAAPPPTATFLRDLLLTGQFIHSHALHFFMLAAPDFLLGDAPAAERNVIGLARRSPEIAKKAIEVRKLGQRITEAVGGKPIHPSNAVPGGMSLPLAEERRKALLASAQGGLAIAREGWETARGLMDGIDPSFGGVETAFLGMARDGVHALSGGEVKVIGPDGREIGSFAGADYLDHIEEYSEGWSYLKFCRLAGGDAYRVGPLARLNIAESMGTPEADAALAEYRGVFGRVVQAPLAYNIARYIEFLSACEQAVALLEDPGITGTEVRTPVTGVAANRGIGIIEAPRGTLIHDYTVDGDGMIERCNLIVATCQNNYAMDRGVEDVARKVIKDGELTEEGSNKIEMVIRAYDPCISCATHAIGRMPMRIEVVRRTGTGCEVLDVTEVN
ncbi:Ni/Fe hydrogenase subunit alpha [Methanofollis formosanus]|uniref:Ni/Fe hydrogenase subunit alpha n=1 Tax=Methanofollis formosanus TaxID=299308 RepID=A0A8G1EFF6_9EURY|nr:Ni/Fe hydrogenase subunit alpha [Methanofollis formosanus]QYZ78733.1 Ni/Fe hydrogenase subunit alpha [Methanofollis formosanus]